MSTVLITGATGSFGSALARHLLATTTDKLRLLARSESKLSELQSSLGPSPRITYILADVRDLDRLTSAFEGVDFVYHAAALKRVPEGKLFTSEFVKTNIGGTQNVNTAAGRCGVKKVILVSTDKACQPHNEYGKIKAVAECMTIESNMVWHGTHFSCVRGGNIWGSKGSVMEKWAADDPISLYGDCTRFHLSMSKWVRFCSLVMDNVHGGEIFIPKCKAWNLVDLADAYALLRKVTVNQESSRDGDKSHEVLFSKYESPDVKDIGWAYVLEPSSTIRDVWAYKGHQGKPVLNEEYGSDSAVKLNTRELQIAIGTGGEI